jgi:hypothetical protein
LCFSGCLVSSAGNKIYFFESWQKALVRCCRCFQHAISRTLFVVLMVQKFSSRLP